MIPEVKKILFISDLSKSSKQAFYYAASIASFYNGNIDILHAMEDIQGSMKMYVFSFLGEDLWNKYENTKENQARSILIGKKSDVSMIKDALEVLSEDYKEKSQEDNVLLDQIIVKNKEADISEEIHNQCQKKKYDMIVSSYKCFTNFTDIRSGSKIKKTIKSNNIPLLLVPALEKEWGEEEEGGEGE